MSTIRRLAATTALTLTAAGLGAVAAQPASAAGDQVLEWGLSSYLHQHLTSQSFTDGATVDSDGVVSFTGGAADGDGTIHYQGVARYAFAAAGVEYYSFTFSDLQLAVDDAGVGALGADVAWTSPAGAGSVENVPLAAFSTDDDWSDGALTGTPDWTGVADADAYGSGKPVDGASWAVPFVQALPSSLNPTFYASGSSSDATKAPASFTATTTAAAAAPAVTTSTAYAGKAATIEVSGTGFSAVTEPGDMGVYVGLAPSGGMPDTSSQESMDEFADSEWVMPAQMADGTFTVTLDPDNALLDPRETYSVYTWQAHTHSNPSQDTETPVTIDFSKLGSAAQLKAVVQGKNLKVTVGGKTAAGKVVAKLTKGTTSKSVSAAVKKGVATLKLGSLAKGKWKAALTYTSSTAAYRSAKKTVTVKR